MVKKKKKDKQEDNCFYVSRDRLCPISLSSDEEDLGKCGLPYTHEYECTYTVVYKTSHLKVDHHDCGCIVYHNQHYYEFKYPEAIWMSFFQEGIAAGEKNVKFTVRKCYKK
jgi:hypothetical protein